MNQVTDTQTADLLKVIKPFPGNPVHASSIQLTFAGNDALVIFMQPRPATMPDGSIAPIALSDTSAMIHMSVATLKDFSVLLNDTIGQYEKDFGPVETHYTRQMARNQQK